MNMVESHGLGVPDSPRIGDLPLMTTYAKKSENDENSCIPAKPIFKEALAESVSREIMAVRWMAEALIFQRSPIDTY